jgi:cytosine/adenosine deaminase-related metal-dependent hydrolase
MRFITADIILPVTERPLQNGILVVEGDKILDILDPAVQQLPEGISPEKYNGALCPGFVNAHCHLELSHMKGRISKAKGLTGFITELLQKRNAARDKIEQEMLNADQEMFKNGIIAVGDISNEEISIPVKKKSKIHYHNFIEVFDLNREAKIVFENGLALCDKFISAGLPATISPHAPYTVSRGLLKLISENALKKNSPLTIHNQETASEDQMFLEGSGELMSLLKMTGSPYVEWMPHGESSLRSMLKFISHSLKIQLVHNTFSKNDDVKFSLSAYPNLFWCLCVNANRFIENVLPDIEMFRRNECLITTGTDSYASNDSLSVLDELKTISSNFPEIPLNEMITWATINGAKFLGIENKFGSMKKGFSPGILHIDGISMDRMNLTSASTVRRVV